jgi:beta-phosphoglucomutase
MADSTGRGAIWDVDGTMVDTAEIHFRAWQQVFGEIHQSFTRRDFDATFGQRNADILHQLFGDSFDARQIADLGDHKEQAYRALASKGVQPLPGLMALLEDLKRVGFRQAIASSAPRANLDLIIALLGVESFFDVVVSSEDTQRGKPDPQVFLIAAERLGLPPARCVVLEDAAAGVQAARAGGMKCIAVRSGGHHSEEKLKEAGADLVAATLQQVHARSVLALLG